jgi:hypothetical protein
MQFLQGFTIRVAESLILFAGWLLCWGVIISTVVGILWLTGLL